jgi:hypothetical protein
MSLFINLFYFLCMLACSVQFKNYDKNSTLLVYECCVFCNAICIGLCLAVELSGVQMRGSENAENCLGCISVRASRRQIIMICEKWESVWFPQCCERLLLHLRVNVSLEIVQLRPYPTLKSNTCNGLRCVVLTTIKQPMF